MMKQVSKEILVAWKMMFNLHRSQIIQPMIISLTRLGIQNCTPGMNLLIAKKCSQKKRIQALCKEKRRHSNNLARWKLNSKTQVYQGILSSRINTWLINLNLRATKTRGKMRKALLIRLILSLANQVGVIAKEATATERNLCKKSSNHDFWSKTLSLS